MMNDGYGGLHGEWEMRAGKVGGEMDWAANRQPAIGRSMMMSQLRASGHENRMGNHALDHAKPG